MFARRLGKTRHSRAATLARMYDEDADRVEELDEDEGDDQDLNAHTLSIRRADGEEIITILKDFKEDCDLP